MFEDKNINEFDQMMKSILDEGREEVPASVWEGVSAGLDKAEKHKTVVLWWRRAAAGAAVAAAVAVGVIFNHTPQQELVPQAGDSGMIAVAEPADEIVTEETEIVIPDMIAEAEPVVKPVRNAVIKTADEAIEVVTDVATADEIPADVVPADKAPADEAPADEKKVETKKEYFPEDWGEETPERKADVSLVLSGLASTNDAQSQNRMGPMKAPSVNPAPKKTGITETSTKSTYGIPVSFGAGVKVDFNERWSLGVGANYTLLARKFYGKYTKVTEAGGIENSISSDIRNTQHFVGIPVNAYYNIISKDRINLYAYAGGTVEKCVSDNYNVLGTSIYHKEKAEGVQLSADAGIGVEFMLGKHMGLYIDPSLRYYFDCGQPKSIRTVQPLMFGFEMGFRFRL
ncbi:MAG: outer membrane beta-barrel protein [Bacteroidales bacterium]|nr:outer membrane beta-barrel protein [Bacteroidales bacterium]